MGEGTSPRQGSAARGGRYQERDTAWQACLLRIAQGDQQAFARLYDESKALVYTVALRILNDVGDAEETVVDVYTQVWKAATKHDPTRGSVSNWLAMLARSRAIDRLRSSASRQRFEQPLAPAQDNVPAGGAAEAFAYPRRQAVEAALGMLRQEERELVELAFFSGFTQSELAARTKLPLGTVKTRIRAALGRLRELLGESGAYSIM